MSVGYTWEKLDNAVDALATGKGRIGDRMATAMLCCHTLRANEEDFPDEHERATFAQIVERMTSAHDSQEGAFVASGRTLEEDELVALAEKLLELHGKVVERYHAEDRS